MVLFPRRLLRRPPARAKASPDLLDRCIAYELHR
jgi:hypothetical protein